MKKIKNFLFTLICLFVTSCNSSNLFKPISNSVYVFEKCKSDSVIVKVQTKRKELKTDMLEETVITYLKNSEGFASEPYNLGGWTIGYGHLMKKTETFKKISKSTGDSLIRCDFRAHSIPLKEFPNLKHNEKLALTMFIFALGEGRFRRSSIYRKLVNNEPLDSMDFIQYQYFKGVKNKKLKERRIREWNLYSKGGL